MVPSGPFMMSPRDSRGPLATSLVDLASTPDEAAGVDEQIVTIARLTAERVAAATYASVTALRGEDHVTVALSDEVVRSVDEAQYADNAGPCLESLATGTPVPVPDIAATVQWPSFHEEAPRMGLHASVSVPLYAGRGVPIAVLNIYGHDSAAMTPLIAGICQAHGHPGDEPAGDGGPPVLDEGGRELIAGYAEVLAVRATIRLALDVVMARTGCAFEDAYRTLCSDAAQSGTSLAEAASTVIASAV